VREICGPTQKNEKKTEKRKTRSFCLLCLFASERARNEKEKTTECELA
jgi:hypothetical protein